MKYAILLSFIILIAACKKDDDPQPLTAPVATDASDITNEGFTANWNAVDGLPDYLLYVSLGNIPADPPTFIPGYDGASINGTSHTVSGLNSGTIYYYAVRTRVDARVSEMSNSIETETGN